MNKRSLFILILVFGLVSCTPPPAPAATLTPTLAISPTDTPTLTSSPSITSTQAATFSPTASSSPTPVSLTGWVFFGQHWKYIKKLDLGTGKIITVLDDDQLLDSAISSKGEIYFLHGDYYESMRLYRCGLDGKNRKLVASAWGGIGQYKISPDGDRVAYLARRSGPDDLLVIDYKKGGMVYPIFSTRFIDNFSWSNKGERLAFIVPASFGGVNPEGNVYIVDSNGANLIQINTPYPLSTDPPVWSPDDSQIVVSLYRIILRDLEAKNLYLADVDTQAFTQLTDSEDQISNPVWSPKGDKILFWKGTSIGVISPDGTGMKILADTKDSDAPLAAWSPDGRFIIYRYRPSTLKYASLFVVPVEGGTPIQISQGEEFYYGDGMRSLTWINAH